MPRLPSSCCWALKFIHLEPHTAASWGHFTEEYRGTPGELNITHASWISELIWVWVRPSMCENPWAWDNFGLWLESHRFSSHSLAIWEYGVCQKKGVWGGNTRWSWQCVGFLGAHFLTSQYLSWNPLLSSCVFLLTPSWNHSRKTLPFPEMDAISGKQFRVDT